MRQSIKPHKKEIKQNFSSPAIVRLATTRELDSYYYNASLMPMVDQLSGITRRLALLIYNDRMAGAIYSDRSLRQLSLMFGCTMRHISRCLNYLKHIGYITGKGRRWLTKMWKLTLEGFMKFEAKFPSVVYKPSEPINDEMSSLKSSYTNIDLFSDKEVKNNIQDIQDKDAQLIGKATDLRQLADCLTEFMSTKSIQRHHRQGIYALFDRVNLPIARRIEIFDRVVAASCKEPIRAYYGYFKAAFINAVEKFEGQMNIYKLRLKSHSKVPFHIYEQG